MKRKAALMGFFLLLGIAGYSQSRIFISGGMGTSLGGSIDLFTASNRTLPTLDLEYEKKIVGSMSVLTGLSYYQVGYTYDASGFNSAKSDYKAQYAALPVMARWNMFNRHFLHLDFGLVASYLTQAHLTENFSKFGFPQKAEGNVEGYSNRLLLGAKFQETIMLNRLTITVYYLVAFKGQNTIKNLPDHWPLNSQQSTYLQSNGYSDYSILGLKLGLRIK